MSGIFCCPCAVLGQLKVILDIGCMRSVAGLEWTNSLLRRWRSEGRWCRVFEEREAFKFGDGEVLWSRFRVEFMGTFAGKTVVYGFSVVEGCCPPLFSRSGCTQIGAVIDCEHHCVSARKLGVKRYGVGRDSGHYTVPVDECEPGCAVLPGDYCLPSGADIAAVDPQVFSAQMSSPLTDRTLSNHVLGAEPSTMPNLQEPRASHPGLPSGGFGRRDLRDDVFGGDGTGRGRGSEPRQEECSQDPGSGAATSHGPGDKGILVGGNSGHSWPDPRGSSDHRQAPREAGSQQSQGPGGESLDRVAGRLPFPQQCLELRAGPQHRSIDYQQDENLVLEEVGVDGTHQVRHRKGGRSEVEEEPPLAEHDAGEGSGGIVRPFRVDAPEAPGPRNDTPHVKMRHLNRGEIQKLKVGVKSALATLKVFDCANKDDGKWVLLEVFAGKARLTEQARQHPLWTALEPIDVLSGWDLQKEGKRKELLDLIDKEAPDLVTLSPPCGPWSSWTQLCQDIEGLWERRRQRLPFWKLAGEVWQRQCDGGRLVLLEQPARSEALKLRYMTSREDVVKAVVAQCAFGLKDLENGKPYVKLTSLDVNCSVMAVGFCTVLIAHMGRANTSKSRVLAGSMARHSGAPRRLQRGRRSFAIASWRRPLRH